jgi:BirA family transcriptional regulator, biotin operon repressor / biotin---[acetyl-CoA-carboxylase] ligase
MKGFQPKIIRFNSLPSTNTEAARQAIQGAEEGLCVVATEQTAGRGRLDRPWFSPCGAGLYFSIVLRPRIDASTWPLITLTAALAVHDALLETCGFQADIKWPNDIMVNERKLCGILAETIDTGLGRAVILGIGINLTSKAFPPHLLGAATSIQETTGGPGDYETVLQALVCALQERYHALQTPDGPNQVVREWSQHSSFANGKHVYVSNGMESFVGVTRGLESDGALRVETDQGEVKIVRAGDITTLRPS